MLPYIAILFLVAALCFQHFFLQESKRDTLFWQNAHSKTFGLYLDVWEKLHCPLQRRMQHIYNSHLKKAYKKRYRSFFARGKELGTNERGFALYNLNHAANQRHWLQSYKNNDLAGRAVKSNDVPVLLANHKKYLDLAHGFTIKGPKLP